MAYGESIDFKQNLNLNFYVANVLFKKNGPKGITIPIFMLPSGSERFFHYLLHYSCCCCL